MTRSLSLLLTGAVLLASAVSAPPASAAGTVLRPAVPGRPDSYAVSQFRHGHTHRAGVPWHGGKLRVGR